MSITYLTVGELLNVLSSFPRDQIIAVPRPYTYKMPETGTDVNEYDSPLYFTYLTVNESWDVYVETDEPYVPDVIGGPQKLLVLSSVPLRDNEEEEIG